MVSSSRALENTSVYTDIQGLSALRGKASGTESKQALEKVAQQFESVFMNMVMKSMRDANSIFSKDNPFESQESQFFQQMYDSQLSLTLSKKNGFGIADMIVKQMSKYVSSMGLENQTETSAPKRLPNVLPKYKDATVSGTLPSPAAQNGELASLREMLLKDVDLSDAERLYLDEPLNMEEGDKPQAPETRTMVDSFENAEEFVRTLYPIAKQAADEIGVDPKVLLAQAALETGWGKHVIEGNNGKSSYNLFNIKANSNWIGDKVAIDTLEYKDGKPLKEKSAFKVYDSLEESFADYVQLLKNSKRYQQALKNAENPFAFARSLQQAGYATDPEYAGKISRIYSGATMDAAVDQQVRTETGSDPAGGDEWLN